MTATGRALLVAAAVAAALGFAAGWFARVWSEPTVESRLEDAGKDLRRSIQDLTR